MELIFAHHTTYLVYANMFHSKATYLLRVHQFTAQQVGKGGKEGTNFHSSLKSYLEYANMFVQRQPTP